MILCDAHVHIYDRFDLNLFFLSAARNFSQNVEGSDVVDYAAAVIFLADWSNISWFDRLRSLSGRQASQQAYSILPTRDDNALRIVLDGAKPLYVIAAKKIITSEDLEVLALCSSSVFPDGRPLRATVASIQESGAIPVIPWAVGKWMGSRGQVLDDLLDHPGSARFYLCDNGNRPVFWRWPKHFEKATRSGIPILSGSDPLHFETEADRVGRSGFGLDGTLLDESPAGDIHERLMHYPAPLFRYGALESPIRFIRNQILMQLFKKKWRKELLK